MLFVSIINIENVHITWHWFPLWMHWWFSNVKITRQANAMYAEYVAWACVWMSFYSAFPKKFTDFHCFALHWPSIPSFSASVNVRSGKICRIEYDRATLRDYADVKMSKNCATAFSCFRCKYFFPENEHFNRWQCLFHG